MRLLTEVRPRRLQPLPVGCRARASRATIVGLDGCAMRSASLENVTSRLVCSVFCCRLIYSTMYWGAHREFEDTHRPATNLPAQPFDGFPKTFERDDAPWPDNACFGPVRRTNDPSVGEACFANSHLPGWLCVPVGPRLEFQYLGEARQQAAASQGASKLAHSKRGCSPAR